MLQGGRDSASRAEPPDRSLRSPLWAQVLADLRRRIASGDFAAAFPTDEQLVRDYGVSRHTVREAVRHLVSEGLLERRRRTGSRLRPVEFEQPLGSLYSLFREIEGQGVSQESRVLALEVCGDAGARARLGLPPGTGVLYLKRVRLADGRPLAVDSVWLPADLAGDLLHADFSRTALYDELSSRCGVAPSLAREQIRPAEPTKAEAALLGYRRPEPVFAIERASWTAGGRPLEWRITLVRGDRYAFVAEWASAHQAADGSAALRPVAP